MKIFVRLLFYLAAPIAVALICYVFFVHAFLEPVDPRADATTLVEVRSGMSLNQILKDLQSRGLVRYWWTISIISRIKGEDRKVAAGEYELAPSMSPKQILEKLVSGDVYVRTVTFREGQSIWELGALVEEAGLLPSEEFTPLLTNEELLHEAGIGAESFEGYLFPETYRFSKPITAKQIIWKMLEEAEKQWRPEYAMKSAELSMSRHEALTLASIIEKESGNVAEQPLISAVFHNRMSKGMRLQSDPTVVYGIPDFDGVILRKHLETPTPYNTYVNFGLPPGPICNPGASAIKAALYPEPSTDYLYFVADGQGGHIFSATLKEHNEAVAEYRKVLQGAIPE